MKNRMKSVPPPRVEVIIQVFSGNSGGEVAVHDFLALVLIHGPQGRQHLLLVLTVLFNKSAAYGLAQARWVHGGLRRPSATHQLNVFVLARTPQA